MEESQVITYIESTIVNATLKAFLKDMISSAEINKNLLCLCILIELKNCLLCEDEYSSVLDKIIAVGDAINYDSFINTAEVLFRESCPVRTEYSRVVSKENFETRISSFGNNRFEIDPEKIRDNGWSSRNGVVWITPQRELSVIIANAKLKPFPADDVCDHVGFPRIRPIRNTRSPASQDLEFLVINYSASFPDDVYQSNSSNANWYDSDLLFISYPKTDGWGRTYNENDIDFAKEQVHHTSFYYDPNFTPEYIGKMSINPPTRSGILDEAFRRLGL